MAITPKPNSKPPFTTASLPQTKTPPLPQEEKEEQTTDRDSAVKKSNLQIHQENQSCREIGKLSGKAKASFLLFHYLISVKSDMNELLTFRLKGAEATEADIEKVQQAWRLISDVHRKYDELLGFGTFDRS